MLMNFMLFLMMYPIMILVYYIMMKSAQPKNGIAFGAVIKKEWMEDEGIAAITADFFRKMKRNLLVLALVPFLCFFTEHLSIQITIWMIWLLVMLALIEFPYAAANKKVRARKREMGWYEQANKTAYTEVKAAGAVRRVHFLPFAAPVFLSAAAGAAGYLIPLMREILPENVDYIQIESFRLMVLCLSLITLLFYIAAVWMDRQKTEVISLDSDINVNYARANKNIWKNFWLRAAWLNTLYICAVAVAMIADLRFFEVIFWGVVAFTLLGIFLCFPMIREKEAVERKYRTEMDPTLVNDDDDNWLWGTLYYNPGDRHIMVSKRVGIGTTINAATPVGKGFLVFSAAAILSLPIMCVWLILLEFTPISLKVSENCLKAEHLKVDYEIPVSDIENPTLIYECPSLKKISGTAMERVEKGTFRISGGEKCEVFLNPQNAVFIQFDADGTTYFMSGADDKETKEAYENITK